jgi:hypothetical protein
LDTSLGLNLKVMKEDGGQRIGVNHPSDSIGHIMLMEVLGTEDPYFLNGFLRQLADATSLGGDFNARRLNFMLSAVKGIKPRDQTEAMLAAQMAAVHDATMTLARLRTPKIYKS